VVKSGDPEEIRITLLPCSDLITRAKPVDPPSSGVLPLAFMGCPVAAGRRLIKNRGETIMGDVVHANFGNEKEWETTRMKIRDGLRTIGEMYGDDLALMDAKAEVAYKVLRDSVENLPLLSIKSRVPEELDEEGRAMVIEEVKKAALAGIETAMAHSVALMMAALYDLCTSKLARQ
jgi:hypothetical protein